MSRDLAHLVGQIFNTPHLMQGKKLQTILNAIGPRLLAGEAIDQAAKAERRAERVGGTANFANGGFLSSGGIAVLPVYGTLVRRGSWLDSMSGMTSYQRIESSILEMADHPSVRGVMLDIDSYGGEAGGCFDLVATIVDVMQESGKPLWAIANEAAASAAYAIACAADRIWVPQMGTVGSVGVVAAHVDLTKADAMAGQKWTFVFAGDRKLDGNPHLPLTDAMKADEQADIDDLYTSFINLVATHRNMSADAVRATQARMYRGSKALGIGLADDAGTFSDAMQAFAEHLDTTKPALSPGFTAGAFVSGGGRVRADSEPLAINDLDGASELDEQADDARDTQALPDDEFDEHESDGDDVMTLPPVTTAKTRLPVALTSDDAVRLERERVAGLEALARHAERSGLPSTDFILAEHIKAGTRVEAARAHVFARLAEIDDMTATRVTSTVHTADESNRKATAKAGYDRAIERQAQRLGLNK